MVLWPSDADENKIEWRGRQASCKGCQAWPLAAGAINNPSRIEPPASELAGELASEPHLITRPARPKKASLSVCGCWLWSDRWASSSSSSAGPLARHRGRSVCLSACACSTLNGPAHDRFFNNSRRPLLVLFGRRERPAPGEHNSRSRLIGSAANRRQTPIDMRGERSAVVFARWSRQRLAGSINETVSDDRFAD